MCQLFTHAAPQLYTSRSRSFRLRGVATSIRLENIYWQVLDEISRRDQLTVPQLVTRLHDELSELSESTGAGDRGSAGNFASFLRVSCSRYMQLQLAGLIPQDPAIPIRTLDAARILAAERELRRNEEYGDHPASAQTGSGLPSPTLPRLRPPSAMAEGEPRSAGQKL